MASLSGNVKGLDFLSFLCYDYVTIKGTAEMPRYELNQDDLKDIDDALACWHATLTLHALCNADHVIIHRVKDLRERFQTADAAYIEEPER